MQDTYSMTPDRDSTERFEVSTLFIELINTEGDMYTLGEYADSDGVLWDVAGGKFSKVTLSETLDLNNTCRTVVDKEGYIIGAAPVCDTDDSGTGMLTYEQ